MMVIKELSERDLIMLIFVFFLLSNFRNIDLKDFVFFIGGGSIIEKKFYELRVVNYRIF